MESAIAVLALADLFQVDQNLSPARAALPSSIHTDIIATPDGELLGYLHEHSLITAESGYGQQQQKNIETPVLPPNASSPQTSVEASGTEADPEMADEPQLSLPGDKYKFPFGITVSTKTQPILWGDRLCDLEDTLLTRRSTRRYSRAPLDRSDVFAVLDFTYHPEHYLLQDFDQQPDYFDLSLIETFVAISNVDGLEPGCYYYAPNSEELRQIRFNQFHKDLHFLCLGQDLGRDAGAVIFHTANLEAAVAKYGDRVYRYLHMDAGHLGQRINLAATQRQVGVSGIAGFFDDQVNELLSIPAEEAVLYITTIGKKPTR